VCDMDVTVMASACSSFPPPHVSIDLRAGDSVGRIPRPGLRAGDAHRSTAARRLRLSQHPLPVPLHQGKTRPNIQPRNQTKWLKVQKREAQEGEQPGLRRRNSRRDHWAPPHHHKGPPSSYLLHLLFTQPQQPVPLRRSSRHTSRAQTEEHSPPRPDPVSLLLPVLMSNADIVFPPA
jgi:hypothetical protein